MAYLVRTPSSAGNRKTFTISAWIKPNVQSSDSISMFSAWSADNNASHFVWRINSNGTIGWSRWSEDSYSTRQLRDTNAWYHCVIAVDTTQATASDRVKLYVNNEQITSFSVGANYPAQNTDLPVNNTNIQTIGLNNFSSGQNPFKGYMSHFNLVDGTALTPSAFGEYDANGVWTINTSPSVTYGTNGFFILKDGNSVTDQSGNGNNWTVASGTLTNTEDCPSNVFATANPLQQNSTILTFTNGNNTVAEPSGNSVNWTTRWGMSTLAFSSGKFYAEAKISDYGTGQLYPIGIVRDEDIPNINSSVGTNGYGLYIYDGRIIGFGSDIQTGLGSFSTNDIIGLALDADNRTFQYYKNGSTLGSQVTNITAGTYFFTSSAYANHGVQFNFGNGYFGTTAVASAGTNASGIGIFEYDVPTGYTALSTKGLNL
jgi:hypothetical protein